ncbi:hypothetical protein E0H75_40795 [Kribbella capetownensis]|uniref:TPR repeat domain-containing protein n=1 Tax=Kribbella capetownensis TaxID=1572659 RepID=A0A4R0J0J5_9ACTN|nr:hypothetical protein [Kribbella capetownensis]TCC37478.1 hypothetical protein E0H75_40795 [Kribbella capetownensis]
MARKDEGGRHSSLADGFCMIDPVVLGGVINDLATMEAAIGTELKGLKAEFDKVGVSTHPITNLTNVGLWLHDQLPMLRRRHAAAVLLESQGMQVSAGTTMLSMPEDPTTATKQAVDLAVKNVRAALNGKPPGRDSVVAAIRAIERIRNTKGRLSPDDLLFLQSFYTGLGKDVYKVPDYLKDDKNWIAPTRTTYMPGEIVPTAIDAKTRAALAASVVGGLLTLSDERRGGGWNRLPEFVREAASDPWHYPMSTSAMGGQKAQELAAFLANSNGQDQAGTVLSKRLAITVSESAEALRSIHPPVNDEIGKTFLTLAGRNEKAMHDLLTNQGMGVPADGDADVFAGYKGAKEFLTPLVTYAWSDDGKAASSVFDWIADAKQSTDPQRRTLATEAMQGLVTTLADPAVLNQALDTEWSGREAVGVVNPEIARSLAHDTAAFLKEFSDPAADLFTTDAKGMTDGQKVTARFFTLVATDPTAAEALAASIYRYNVDGIHDELAHPGHVLDHAHRAAQLDIMLDSALNNVALERTDDKELAAAEANAIRGKALGIVSQFLGKGTDQLLGEVKKELPSIPGVDPVDIADRILGRFIGSDTEPVEPQQIKTEGLNTRATGAPLLLIRYNITQALVESGQLDVNDLPEAIRSSDVPPRLKSPAEFRPSQYNDLADTYKTATGTLPGGKSLEDDYLKAYTEITALDQDKYRADSRDGLKNKLGIS